MANQSWAWLTMFAVAVSFNSASTAFAQDSDGDGVADSSDNCPQIANANQADCDGDGTGNVCEIAGGATDENCNGIPDRCEQSWGDFDLSGAVSGDDLGYLLSAWGTGDRMGDLDENGLINGADLAYVLLRWGPTPFPPRQPLQWAETLACHPDPAVVTDVALFNAIVGVGLPWRVRDHASNIEMVLIPPGTFVMGCSQGSTEFACYVHEQPVHQVMLTSPFYLGRTEVTQAEWEAEMASNPSAFRGTDDSPLRPVEQVTWSMTQDFLFQNSLRLPTEAEWEFACRAGTTTAFYNGSNDDATLANLGWYVGNNDPYGTKPVATKSPNALGIFDTLGNVSEWVNDWWESYPSSTPVTNPHGPVTGTHRVLRGGGWYGSSSDNRVSNRNATYPAIAFFTIGFRVARTP